MKRLRAAGLVEVLPTLKQPVLGICVGMQLLFDSSEEGNVECLGIIPDTVRRLQARAPVARSRTWAGTRSSRCATIRCSKGITGTDYVYFVHSYAAPVSDVTLRAHATTARRSQRSSAAATSGAPSSIRNVRPKPARASSLTFSG